MAKATTAVEIGLSAAIVTIAQGEPQILATHPDSTSERAGLPSGAFDPIRHRTLDKGLREWVEEQTRLRIGYAEQLYTFGDRGRQKITGDEGVHVVSVGYLALTRPNPEDEGRLQQADADWRRWYDFLPWEDWRGGKPGLIDGIIIPRLSKWADETATFARQGRLHLAFGSDDLPWDEERALERYELLYEAGLIDEAVTDGRIAATNLERPLGEAMAFDQRRILATAIARLRGKLKYRPVIFELMSSSFTLTALQESVEAISGRHLHKQNFRRLVENTELVEPTGATLDQPRGRPAALYRFRQAVLQERPSPGLRLGIR
ncbi:MAG: NUDIX hydrolase [Phyllobacterium sp.]